MRILLFLAIGCGQAATDPLPLPTTTKPPPPPPAIADAGESERDADTARPPADMVPGVMEFFPTPVGTYADRALEAINRNNVATTVVVLSDPNAYDVYPSEIEVPSNSRRELTVRFNPSEIGVHEEFLEIDACAQGCVVSVRLVGTAE